MSQHPPVEVFADVLCPFAHVGLRRLRRHRSASGRDEVRFWVRSWPLELVNGAPLDADLIAAEVDDLRRQVAPDLFTGFDPSRWPSSSLPALELAAAGYRDSLEAGERLSFLLRDAVFEQGADIGQADVLARIAATAGIAVPGPGARQAVEADWAEGRDRHVLGSPHFFIGSDGYFCPALDIHRVGEHLQIRSDPAAFDAFVKRCFDDP